ncbi:MAG: TIR domain-containing protein [Candidatus Bathyarchaeota archaeon]|nr:TIR domain-containing protein [Candidatus Bathyarchaeota archaeon]
MGGGGGGGRAPSSDRISDVEKLKDIARRELEKPAPEPRRRVFLSFRGEDKTLVDLFRGQAKNKNTDLDFIDFSLRAPFNSENAEYIKRGIRERIRQPSVTVVLITESTHQSEWVDWEIRESVRLGKGVIGVRLRDDSSMKIPSAMEEHGFRVVGWNHSEIRQAINEAAENR